MGRAGPSGTRGIAGGDEPRIPRLQPWGVSMRWTLPPGAWPVPYAPAVSKRQGAAGGSNPLGIQAALSIESARLVFATLLETLRIDHLSGQFSAYLVSSSERTLPTESCWGFQSKTLLWIKARASERSPRTSANDSVACGVKPDGCGSGQPCRSYRTSSRWATDEVNSIPCETTMVLEPSSS
jgi:hypothetical protein